MRNQKGFTLIELLISISLGLLLTAAAVMLFITGFKSYAFQRGTSDIQDNANFGLNQLSKDLRLVNLNNSNSILNSETVMSGIVFSSVNNAYLDRTQTPPVVHSNFPATIVGNTANALLLSRGNGQTVGTSPSWSGVSNVTTRTGTAINSDQLVVQYTPQYVLDNKGTANTSDDEWFGGYDCEGRELRFAVTTTASRGWQIVVQRYFLRADTNTAANEPNSALALACDAGSYDYDITSNPAAVNNYGDAGEILMKRVDHFHVLLAIHTANDRYRYLTIAQYMALAAPRPRVLSMQIGMLVRSNESLGAVTEKERTRMNAATNFFTVLDQEVKVPALAANERQYVRQVVSQTVAFRNSFGERGQ